MLLQAGVRIANESPSWTGIANLRGACKKLYHKAGLYGLMRSKS